MRAGARSDGRARTLRRGPAPQQPPRARSSGSRPRRRSASATTRHAGRTHSIRLVTDVINLPLRLPALLAKSAASLDVLSGGRVGIGIGAGGFWDAIQAMGGPSRTPKESVDALIEAIAIVRDYWAAEGGIHRRGEYYTVEGAKGGPPPAHDIGLGSARTVRGCCGSRAGSATARCRASAAITCSRTIFRRCRRRSSKPRRPLAASRRRSSASST